MLQYIHVIRYLVCNACDDSHSQWNYSSELLFYRQQIHDVFESRALLPAVNVG